MHDLEKLEKMIRMVLDELSEVSQTAKLVFNKARMAKVRNGINLAHKSLPEHEDFFVTIYKEIGLDSERDYPKFTIRNTISVFNHILEIIEIEKTSEAKIKEMKIFESAEEKMKQANLSFRKEDYASVFHNLNTVLELILKDKVGIPITITGINTSNIIDLLIKDRTESHLYLSEARKRVLMIDNKIKHQAYLPSKIDCINGLTAMEELISKLRGKEIKLTEETKKKIFQGLWSPLKSFFSTIKLPLLRTSVKLLSSLLIIFLLYSFHIERLVSPIKVWIRN